MIYKVTVSDYPFGIFKLFCFTNNTLCKSKIGRCQWVEVLKVTKVTLTDFAPVYSGVRVALSLVFCAVYN